MQNQNTSPNKTLGQRLKLWAFTTSAYYDQVGIVELLAYPSIIDEPYNAKYGMTALMIASRMGSKRVVSYLLSKGAALDKTNAFGLTALDLAAQNGQVDVINLLIQQPALLQNPTGNHVKNALMLAIQYGRDDAVKALLNVATANDISQADQSGKSPLSVAGLNGRLDIIAWLQARIALVSLQDNILSNL
jgi:ankyrin